MTKFPYPFKAHVKEDVVDLQAYLREATYTINDPPGIFGEGTKLALNTLRGVLGLAPSGEVDFLLAQTLRALDAQDALAEKINGQSVQITELKKGLEPLSNAQHGLRQLHDLIVGPEENGGISGNISELKKNYLSHPEFGLERLKGELHTVSETSKNIEDRFSTLSTEVKDLPSKIDTTDNRFVIRCQAVNGKDAKEKPIPGLRIAVFYRGSAPPYDSLGEPATTDAEGMATFQFRISDFAGRNGKKDPYSNLFLKVSRGGVPLDHELQDIPNLEGVIKIRIDKPYVISGTVFGAGGQPAANQLVQAFERHLKGLNFETPLNETPYKTGAKGIYQIAYGPDVAAKKGKTYPDVLVRVIGADGKTLVESKTQFNAREELHIDLNLPADKTPTEIERLLEVVIRLVKDAGSNAEILHLVANLDNEDVKFIVNKANCNPEHLWLLILAAKNAKELTLFSQDGLSDRREWCALYAWYRKGLPQDTAVLLDMEADRLVKTLTQAIKEDLIPDLLADLPVKQITDAILAWRSLQHAETSPLPNEWTTLRDFLNLVPDAAQLKFGDTNGLGKQIINLWSNDDSAKEKWKKLDGLFGEAIQSLKFMVRRVLALKEFTLSNMALCQALVGTTSDTAHGDLRDLVEKNTEDWSILVGQHKVPADYWKEGNENERIAAYVEHLATAIEKRHPSAYIAHRVGNGLIPLKDPSVKQHVVNLVDNNRDFRFLEQSVIHLFNSAELKLDNVDEKARPGLRREMMAIERIAKVAPRLAHVGSVMTGNFRSARSIARRSKAAFVADMQKQKMTPAVAEKIHARARGVVTAAEGLILRLSPQFNRLSLPVMHSPLTPKGGAGQTERLANRTTEPATIAELFGNLDYCECAHGASLLGPAAYLTHLLDRLGNAPKNEAGNTPLQVLLKRRPDLVELDLTGDNTDILLPYIDLVLEVLEAPEKFIIATDSITEVIPDTNPKIIPNNLRGMLESEGLSIGKDARIRKAGNINDQPSWIIHDPTKGWKTRLVNRASPPPKQEQPEEGNGSSPAAAPTAAYAPGTQGFDVTITPQSSVDQHDRQIGWSSELSKFVESYGKAAFPCTLPYNAEWEECRGWLQHLGASAASIHETLAIESKWSDSDSNSNAIKAACDLLHIGPGLSACLTQQSDSPWSDWGFAEGALKYASVVDPFTEMAWKIPIAGEPDSQGWWLYLRRVSMLRSRGRLTHRELLQVLQCGFINHAESDVLEISGESESDASEMVIEKLDAFNLRRIFLLVRLWRKLNWPLQTVDRAIRCRIESIDVPADCPEKTFFKPDFIVWLANVQRLQQRTKLPIDRIVDLCSGKLDTRSWSDYSGARPQKKLSRYEVLFDNPAHPGPQRAEFKLTGESIQPSLSPESGLRTRLTDCMTYISAVTGTTADQLRSLLPQYLYTLMPQKYNKETEGQWIDRQGFEKTMLEVDIGKWDSATEITISIDETDMTVGESPVEVSQLTPKPNSMTITQSGEIEPIKCEYTGAKRYLRVRVTNISGTNPGVWVSARIFDGSAAATDELCVGNLSLVARYALGAKALGLSVQDFLSLSSLTGIDPAQSASAEHWLKFIDCQAQVKTLGFSVADLCCTLRGLKQDELTAADAKATVWLKELRSSLQTLSSDSQAGADRKSVLLRRVLTDLGWPASVVSNVLGTSGLAISWSDFSASLPSAPQFEVADVLKPSQFLEILGRPDGIGNFFLAQLSVPTQALLTKADATDEQKVVAAIEGINKLNLDNTAIEVPAGWILRPQTKTLAIRNRKGDESERLKRLLLEDGTGETGVRRSAIEAFKVTLTEDGAKGEKGVEARYDPEHGTLVLRSPSPFANAEITALISKIRAQATAQNAAADLNPALDDLDKQVAAASTHAKRIAKNLAAWLRFIKSKPFTTRLDPDAELTIAEEYKDRLYREGDKLKLIGAMSEDEWSQIKEKADDIAKTSIDTLNRETGMPDIELLINDELASQSLLMDHVGLEERCSALMSDKLLSHWRASLIENAVSRFVAQTFSLANDVANVLVGKRNEAGSFCNVLVAKNFSESDSRTEPTRTQFPDQYNALNRLDRVVQLIKRSQAGPTETAWLLGGCWENIDFHVMPIAYCKPVDPKLWLLASRYAILLGLRSRIKTGALGLEEIQTAARDGATAIDRIANVLLVTPAELSTLLVSSGLASNAGDLKKPLVLKGLLDLIGHREALGCSASDLLAFARPTNASTAASARALAFAKLGDAGLGDAERAVQDRLRMQRRDAVVDYLVHYHNVRDANDLYGHYLLDSQMQPVQETSRIKQAISSVQLFIQRCLMNLEDEVKPSAIDKSSWANEKNYRVFEASRKILLYPENWIDPELRDDKTPFFDEFVSEALQVDVDDTKATKALSNYLDRLVEVSKLEIVGFCHENDAQSGALKVTHFFARTRTVPFHYFYRRLVMLKSWDVERSQVYWGSWERIDVDIEGHHLFGLVWFGRLFLFWAVLGEDALTPDRITPDSSKVPSPTKYRTIMLSWAERQGGCWKNRKTSEKIPLFLTPFVSDVDEKGVFFTIDRTCSNGECRPTVQVDIYSTLNTHFCLGSIRFDGDAITFPIESFYMPSTGLRSFKFALDKAQIIRYDRGISEHVYMASVVKAGPLELAFDSAGGNGITIRILNVIREDFRLLHSPEKTEPAVFVRPIVSPLVFSDSLRSFVLIPTLCREISPAMDCLSLDLPCAFNFMQRLAFQGVDALLATGAQEEAALLPKFNKYGLTDLIGCTGNKDDSFEYVDFRATSAAFLYHWELFFHIPFSIACYLSKNQKFDEARRWFHFIFDPTDNSPEEVPTRFWRFKPFRDLDEGGGSIEAMVNALAKPPSDTSGLADEFRAQIAYWETAPFNPHLVAQLRPRAYMFAVVMKYLDNLIAWGDQLFRRETLESLNEATQLYILAAQILGRRPEGIPRRTAPIVQSYADLETAGLDELSNAWIAAENLVTAGTENPNGSILLESLYFCVPNNPRLLEYYDTVENRLFKLRNSQNIDGVLRTLPMFEPAIDPGLLVRAAAAGLDVAAVLSEMQAPLPLYRFNVLAQKATELCGEAKSLAASLLSAMEKNDAESLALLRSTHEQQLLTSVRLVKELQLQEAKTQADALGVSLEAAQKRLCHYTALVTQLESMSIPTGPAGPSIQSLAAAAVEPISKALTTVQVVSNAMGPATVAGAEILKKALSRAADALSASLPTEDAATAMVPMNAAEKRQLEELKSGHDLQEKAMDQRMVAQILSKLPDITLGTSGIASPVVIAQIGGSLLSAFANFEASILDSKANEHSYRASLHSMLAGYQRRAAEWMLQAELAFKDIEQISKQISAAGLRLAIAAQELRNHDMQSLQSQEVDEFMHTKFTNQELYGWMKGQMSSAYFRAYQLAYDMAKRAERAFQHELGTDVSYLQFGYWDSLRKGLLAGENLTADLKRMEVAYLTQNTRELEITKHISLRKLDDEQLTDHLTRLQEDGICEFELAERNFDFDFPGHYFRRIKSVSISIPCVVGPYTSVNGTLTLLSSKVREKNIPIGDYSDTDNFRTSYVPLQSIATSSGQNDSGLFELNFRDERYLPFEGAGAVSSRWRFELAKKDLPKDLRAFDYHTISDIVLHLRYTARDGGAGLAKAAIESLAPAQATE